MVAEAKLVEIRAAPIRLSFVATRAAPIRLSVQMAAMAKKGKIGALMVTAKAATTIYHAADMAFYIYIYI